ncbi:PH domain-containing protein [Romboutsia sedimentorum]|uniref:PH domain-containing protein n=1 Tax=Romboutsia sedimentorum TaxID=1368474 RepID=UPI0024DE6056|nr:PH domain-containing protein [Romboutsia sedimentorum]MDK2584487.1 PH domain-containing protein [Romboutsia sedimentorum]
MEVVKLGFFGYENKGKENKAFIEFLGENEEIIYSFKGIRDEIIFTHKRVIMMNSQGITGKKKEFRFYHYNKINSYAIENSGTFDLDSEVKLVIGSVQHEFQLGKGIDVMAIGRLISDSM